MFTLPSLTLSLVVASLIGLAFYLLFGHGWLQLGVYWLVAVLGFFIGQILSTVVGFSFFPIGSVNLVEAIISCLIALLITRALWRARRPA